MVRTEEETIEALKENMKNNKAISVLMADVFMMDSEFWLGY